MRPVGSSVIEHSTVEPDASVGPMSHLRGGAHLHSGANVGNFAEVKNSVLGPGTQMHHFSYIGDATLGARVNVAAGSITCNYDCETRLKRRTEIGVSGCARKRCSRALQMDRWSHRIFYRTLR